MGKTLSFWQANLVRINYGFGTELWASIMRTTVKSHMNKLRGILNSNLELWITFSDCMKAYWQSPYPPTDKLFSLVSQESNDQSSLLISYSTQFFHTSHYKHFDYFTKSIFLFSISNLIKCLMTSNVSIQRSEHYR